MAFSDSHQAYHEVKLHCDTTHTNNCSWKFEFNYRRHAILVHESQHRRRNDANPHSEPARPDDLLVLKLPPRVPDQVPDAVEAVEGEHERERELERRLDEQWHGREPGHQARRLEQVQAQQRLHEVAEPPDVEGARQHAARDAVEDGQVPRYLWPVDAQVRRHRAVEPLLDEDVGALGVGDGLRCGESRGEGEEDC